jgi:hypothetical protein
MSTGQLTASQGIIHDVRQCTEGCCANVIVMCHSETSPRGPMGFIVWNMVAWKGYHMMHGNLLIIHLFCHWQATKESRDALNLFHDITCTSTCTGFFCLSRATATSLLNLTGQVMESTSSQCLVIMTWDTVSLTKTQRTKFCCAGTGNWF